MSLLLETIKLENGKLANLSYHNQRFNHAREKLFSLSPQDLSELIKIPSQYKQGLYRCRVVYGKEIKKIDFVAHKPRQIKSLQVVYDNSIRYSYKYADRKHLQKLVDQRRNSDEIIIIKNHLVTDCSIGNLVFFDGEKWLTPNRPLLEGTQRQKLIDQRQIFPARITKYDLWNFQEAGIINVFYDLTNMSHIKNRNIHP